jgi:4-amino-4-deoxy-L-arabinose transferase-like glycosyltransferase
VSDTAANEREAGRPAVLALAAVIAAGFLLRVANLGSGIPFALGIDEPFIMMPVVRILKTGSFHPHFFDYPTGYIYVQLGAAIVNFLVGAARHSWNNVAHVGPSDFYLWGRFVTATVGTATLALVYRVGLRWGGSVGLAAAALLAVMPMHVRESHFVLTDVPMTFAVVLTLLLSLRASEQPTLRAFLAAGAAAGLAAGIKYSALVAFSMPLAAALAGVEGRTLSRTAALLSAAAACVVAFFVTTPFALLDLPAFLNGFGSLASAYTVRSQSSEASWIIYAKHLRQAFGWPAAILVVGGLLITARRAVAGRGRVKWALLLVFPAVYFYVINGWAYIFARYTLPLVPFLAVWAAIGLDRLVERLAVPAVPVAARNVAAVLVLVAVAPGALGALAFVRAHGTETTQALAWAWMKKSVWRNSAILSEARGLDLPPEHYRAEIVRSVADRDPDALVSAGVEWVVLSSDAWGGRGARPGEPAQTPVPEAYARLLARAASTKVIAPTAGNPGPVIYILRLAGR